MLDVKFFCFCKQLRNWKFFSLCQYICFNRLCDHYNKNEVEIINCSDNKNCLTLQYSKKEALWASVSWKKFRALWVNLLQGEQITERASPELLINYDISHKALSFFNMTHSAADFSHLPYFLTLQHFPADVATI